MCKPVICSQVEPRQVQGYLAEWSQQRVDQGAGAEGCQGPWQLKARLRQRGCWHFVNCPSTRGVPQRLGEKASVVCSHVCLVVGVRGRLRMCVKV